MTISTTQAIILAAGLGKRMRPLTDSVPKPLIDVAGKPLISYAFDLLREVGVTSAVVNTHYLAGQIRSHIQNVENISVQESYEGELLETGGGIAKAQPLLADEEFFVLNSDTICLSGNGTPVLERMQQHWNEDEMDMLLLLLPRNRAIGYDGAGDFVEENGRYRRRRIDEKTADYVFTGVQMLKPKLFEDCPLGAFSMNVIYNRFLDADGWFRRVGFLVHDGNWLHVGDPQARNEAESFIHTLG